MNAKRNRAKNTTPAPATKHSRRKVKGVDASPAETSQTTPDPLVKTFTSEPIDTHTGAGSGLVLLIRNGEPVESSQWRDGPWTSVIQQASRCQDANRDPWSSEPLRMTRRTRADDVQFATFVVWDKDLNRFLANEVLLRVGSVSPIESANLRDASLAWQRVIAMRIDSTAPEEWLGVPASLIPESLRARIRKAASRGKIRSRASTRRARNPVVYNLADCLRAYSELAAIRDLCDKVREDWKSGQREHVMGLDHPVALPVRLGELVAALELLHASQKLALDASPQAAQSAARKRARRKRDK